MPTKKTEKVGEKKAVAKVSPLKGVPVSDWLKLKVSGWQVGAVQTLLDLVKEAAPRSSVSIKWAQPVFEENGPFAYIKPAKAHVTLGFWRGQQLTDTKHLLESGGRDMAHMKLRSAGEIDQPAVKALVEEAVKLNHDKGDPTRR